MNIKKLCLGAIYTLLCTMLFVGTATAKSENKTQQNKIPLTYKTPELAAEDLYTAIKGGDEKKVQAILGLESEDTLSSGDDVADAAERAGFATAYEQKHAIFKDKEGKQGGQSLVIGNEDWPFPIPLVQNKKDNSWHFDSKDGVEEIINRRIGRNELAAITVCEAYIDAQQEYYKLNPEKSPIKHFASRIASQAGKHDGLYWETKEGEADSPFGPLVAKAELQGYKLEQGSKEPYHGYRYRVLTQQGENAQGGAYSYIEKDLMFGGFALLAYPDNYGVSGVMSFIVNQDGKIYEKNLGKETDSMAEKITSFDPDSTWKELALEDADDK